MTNHTKKPRNRSAGIVIKEGKILLMHRVNNGQEYYVFPGGGIENNETPEETAVREINEEMSVKVKSVRLLYELDREGGEHDYYFECQYIDGKPFLRENTNEFEDMKLGKQVYAPMWVELSLMEKLVVHPIEIKEKVLNLIYGNKN